MNIEKRTIEGAVLIMIEPGDATRYYFIVGYEKDDETMVASMEGPLLTGIRLRNADLLTWFRDTQADTGFGHWFFDDVMQEQRTKVNPWTVRAAFLAVLDYLGHPCGG